MSFFDFDDDESELGMDMLEEDGVVSPSKDIHKYLRVNNVSPVSFIFEHQYYVTNDIVDMFIEENDDFLTDVLMRYVQTPYRLDKHVSTNPSINGLVKMLQPLFDKSCTNLVPILSNGKYNLYTPNDGSNERYCFTDDDYELVKSSGINPYTGKPMNPKTLKVDVVEECGSVVSQISVDAQSKKFIFSQSTYDFLNFWFEEGYTFGKVFIRIPYNSYFEFIQTRSKHPIKLYRGMHFKNSAERDNFVNEHISLGIDFSTFNSWSYSIDVAESFAITNGKNNGLILERQFNPDEILVDLRKVHLDPENTSFYSHEDEVIILPGSYVCNMNMI